MHAQSVRTNGHAQSVRTKGNISSDYDLKFLNINVTLLTKSRLATIFDYAMANNITIISVQETRHHCREVPWAQRMAADIGFACAFSDPSLRASGGTREGGAAVFWSRSLGKSSITRSADFPDSSVRVSFADFAVNSVYGPVTKANPHWFNDCLPPQDDGLHKQEFVIGDFNWKPLYDQSMPDFMSMAPALPTTIAGSAITRLIFSNAADAEVSFLDARALPDIPTHLAVTYGVKSDFLQRMTPRPLTRLRRCAQYSYTSTDISTGDLNW